jgi:hypothetical protein
MSITVIVEGDVLDEDALAKKLEGAFRGLSRRRGIPVTT